MSIPASGLASGRWLDDTHRLCPLDRDAGFPNKSPHELHEPPVPEPAVEPVKSLESQNQPGCQIRRQVMALKYLVRLGIYNEGFASSSVPDQYQHSLGTDEFDSDQLGLPDNNGQPSG